VTTDGGGVLRATGELERHERTQGPMSKEAVCDALREGESDRSISGNLRV